MWTQIYERKSGGALAPLEGGPTVTLLGEDHNYQCSYAEPGGEAQTLPSSEFHALFREATPDEIEGAGKGHKGNGGKAKAAPAA